MQSNKYKSNMARKYFTSRENALKTMQDNFYKRVSCTSDNEYKISLYFNQKTQSAAILEVQKFGAQKECCTFVEIFGSRDEARSNYEFKKNWLK